MWCSFVLSLANTRFQVLQTHVACQGRRKSTDGWEKSYTVYCNSLHDWEIVYFWFLVLNICELVARYYYSWFDGWVLPGFSWNCLRLGILRPPLPMGEKMKKSVWVFFFLINVFLIPHTLLFYSSWSGLSCRTILRRTSFIFLQLLIGYVHLGPDFSDWMGS